jgi:cell shape-determining protein MreD
MIADLIIGYLAGGIFYMLSEFSFMIYKARKLHRHNGNILFLTILFVPCVIAWPYFAIKRILHNEKDNI